MSPDPPREDTGDDENVIRSFTGEFMEGMMNDDEFFIVPDAPYELDMEEESEYSDSEEEITAHARRTEVNLGGDLTEEQVQGRGRYRLLIPFPVASVVDSDQASGGTGGATEIVSEPSQSSTDVDNQIEVPEEGPSSSSGEAEKREIEMTEEKVEKIKEMMKKISLPSASIPPWATEVDEDSWKKKLNDSISTSRHSKT